MDYKAYAQTHIEQFINGLIKHLDAMDFTLKHRIWEGTDKYGWFSKVVIGVALVFGIMFLNIVWDWWDDLRVSSFYDAGRSVGQLASSIYSEGFMEIFGSGSNFFLLALVEVLVFHFSRRTLEVLTKQAGATAFKDYIDAQKRMIKVMVFAFFVSALLKFLLGIVFSIFFFLTFLKPIFMLGIEVFFLGFAILDNYNEQFGMTIKESFKYIENYVGLALAVGLVLYLFLMVPIIGPIVAPIIAAVTGTLVMHQISDLKSKKTRVKPEDLVVD